MKKRFIPIFFVAIMLLMLVPFSALKAYAADPVCKIEETGAAYETLQAAINAVEDNQTIKVNQDLNCGTPISINNGKTFTIDFNDGSTQHTFTWSDSADAPHRDKDIFTIEGNSNVTVKNMQYKIASDEYGNRIFTVNNTGTLTLKDMTCDSADNIKDTPVRNNGGTVIIDGGNITTNPTGVGATEYSNALNPVVQNLGGTTKFTGNGTYTMNNTNTGAVWLGRVITQAAQSTDSDRDSECGTVIIENGTFNKGLIAVANGKGNITINDATYGTGNGPVLEIYHGGIKSNITVNNITSSTMVFAIVIEELETKIDFQNGNVKYNPTKFCINNSGSSMNSVSIKNGKFGPKSGTTTDIHDEINNLLASGATLTALTDDSDGYTYKVETTKVTPYIKTLPAPNDINLGQKLSDSTLVGGYVQVSSTDSTQVGGLFEWDAPDTTPAISDSESTLYDVTFTPIDTDKYNTVSCKVTITVNSTHTHNLVKVDGQAATETASGWKDYYKCQDSTDACGALFEDASGSTPIDDLTAWKAEGGNGYIAKLNAPKYGITVSSDGTGTASASVSEAASGTKVTLTATPSSGYVFDAWEVISGGVTISNNSFTMPASEISITAHFKKKTSPTPDPKPTPNPDPNPTPSSDPTQSDIPVKEPKEPLLRNYNGNKTIAKAGKNDNEAESEIGGICYMVQQGPLCNAAFAAATPTGFKEAFTFNFSLDTSIYHKTNYDRKRGLFVLNIPKAYQKKGRTFRIIGINKNGQTKVFSDSDMDDDTFTTALDVEGYAFSLIYTDSTVKTEKAVTKGSSSSQNDNIYTVKSGDTLSAIARRLGVNLRKLIDKNDLDNPDKLYIGQKISY